jgi:hypothetical protein
VLGDEVGERVEPARPEPPLGEVELCAMSVERVN